MNVGLNCVDEKETIVLNSEEVDSVSGGFCFFLPGLISIGVGIIGGIGGGTVGSNNSCRPPSSNCRPNPCR